MNSLAAYLASDNINITSEQLAKFELFYTNLIEWNARFNLTAITDREDVIIKHFYDSLKPLGMIAHGANIIDVGCGAGFPSIPLAIMRPDIKLVLIDSLNKRISFIEEMKAVLCLDNITAHHSRAEDFVVGTRETFDIAVARAVAPLNILLEYLSPFVKVGGEIIAYKGSSYLEELEPCEAAIRILRLSPASLFPYTLPNQDGRCLLVFKKLSTCNNLYPRGGNMPRKKPL